MSQIRDELVECCRGWELLRLGYIFRSSAEQISAHEKVMTSAVEILKCEDCGHPGAWLANLAHAEPGLTREWLDEGEARVRFELGSVRVGEPTAPSQPQRNKEIMEIDALTELVKATDAERKGGPRPTLGQIAESLGSSEATLRRRMRRGEWPKFATLWEPYSKRPGRQRRRPRTVTIDEGSDSPIDDGSDIGPPGTRSTKLA